MMAQARKLDELEMITLLRQCAELLAFGYQETLNKEMWFTSEKLKSACDVMKYEFQKNNNLITIH